eukprot:GHVU01215833.1.p1 GENE.GHVU01215833.1~~GHVU01215833.1.p1  ORF type:complete len:114 (-),score=1.85 GHVU01215833.1:557-898(-)
MSEPSSEDGGEALSEIAGTTSSSTTVSVDGATIVFSGGGNSAENHEHSDELFRRWEALVREASLAKSEQRCKRSNRSRFRIAWSNSLLSADKFAIEFVFLSKRRWERSSLLMR